MITYPLVVIWISEIAAWMSFMDPWYLTLASAGNSYRTTHPRSLVAGGKSPERAGAISRDKRLSLAE